MKLSHREMLRCVHALQTHQVGDQLTERLSLSFTRSLLTDLERIDLSTIQQKPAHHLLVIETQEKAGGRRLTEYPEQLDVQVVT
jgi:hypothetical protein